METQTNTAQQQRVQMLLALETLILNHERSVCRASAWLDDAHADSLADELCLSLNALKHQAYALLRSIH